MNFAPPSLTLPGGINLRLGKPSWVELSTTYLDGRLRLGKGSRGSLFVFTRGGAADEAGVRPADLSAAKPLTSNRCPIPCIIVGASKTTCAMLWKCIPCHCYTCH